MPLPRSTRRLQHVIAFDTITTAFPSRTLIVADIFFVRCCCFFDRVKCFTRARRQRSGRGESDLKRRCYWWRCHVFSFDHAVIPAVVDVFVGLFTNNRCYLRGGNNLYAGVARGPCRLIIFGCQFDAQTDMRGDGYGERSKSRIGAAVAKNMPPRQNRNERRYLGHSWFLE